MFLLTSLESTIAFCLDYYILSKLLGYTIKRKSPFILMSICLCSYSLLSLFIDEGAFALLNLLINIIICLILKLLFQNLNTIKILKVHLYIFASNIILSSAVLFILNRIFNDSEIKTINFAVNLLFTLLIVIICKFSTVSITNVIYNTPRKIKNFIFLSFVVSAVLFSLISGEPYFHNTDAWDITIRIVTVAFILIIGMLFPALVINSISKVFYKNRLEMYEKHIQTQTIYYNNLVKSHYELRRFKHDFNNISIGLTDLLNNNKYSEALEMINTYRSGISMIHSEIKFTTGNEIVNAILYDKQKIATKSNSILKVQGYLPESFISSVDLCIIIGNAIDNAIEACEKINDNYQKEISITFTYSAGLVFISITNPVTEKIKIHNGNIATTKNDKLNHGFGIYSIRKAIENYNGTLDISCDNMLFNLYISLEAQ